MIKVLSGCVLSRTLLASSRCVPMAQSKTISTSVLSHRAVSPQSTQEVQQQPSPDPSPAAGSSLSVETKDVLQMRDYFGVHKLFK